jgi:hypothetical protein
VALPPVTGTAGGAVAFAGAVADAVADSGAVAPPIFTNTVGRDASLTALTRLRVILALDGESPPTLKIDASPFTVIVRVSDMTTHLQLAEIFYP